MSAFLKAEFQQSLTIPQLQVKPLPHFEHIHQQIDCIRKDNSLLQARIAHNVDTTHRGKQCMDSIRPLELHRYGQ